MEDTVVEGTGGIGPRKIPGKMPTLGHALAWFGVLLLILALGAHFFRSGNTLVALCLAGGILFHCSGTPWKTGVVGTVLLLGVMEWGVTVYDVIVLRMHMGTPWMRAALILGLVALMTALGAWYTLRKVLQQKHTALMGPVWLQAITFVLTFLALYALRSQLPDVLLLERLFPSWGGLQIFLLAWYAGYIAGKLHNHRTSRKTRKTVWLLFTIVFFGQLGLGLLGVPGVALSEALHIPVPAFILFAPVYRGSFTMMPLLVLAATLLAGSAWCSMLCYFGSIEANIASRRSIQKAPPFFAVMKRYGRGTVLLAGLTIAFALHSFKISSEISVSLALLFALASLVIMLFVAKKYTGMVHCTTFCPMGLVVNLLGSISPWRIGIDRQRCNDCGACEKTCGYRAIDAASREQGQASWSCVLCRDCIGTCRQQAIFIQNFLLPASSSAAVFTVLVVVLHVVFLTAARPM